MAEILGNYTGAKSVKSGPDKIKPATDEIIFQSQCYLIDLVDQVAKSNFDTKYEYFRIVHGNPPTIITNLFGTRKFEPFWSLTPEQYAKFQPTAKILKVEYDDKGEETDYIEMPFDEYMKDTDFRVITNPKIARGGGAGLLNIDWSLKSSNPAAATNVVECSMKIRFESFEELTKVRKVTTKNGVRETSFMDLIAHIKRTSVDPCTNKDVYNPNHYSVKVIVGWSDPTDLDKAQASTMKKLGSVVNKDRKTMILSLARHELEYTNEGVVYLTIECNGRYDVVTKLDASDVFLPYRKEYSYDEADTSVNEEVIKIRSLNDCNTIDGTKRNEESLNELKDKHKEELQKREKSLALTKSKIYSAFMRDLTDKERIFALSVPEDYTNLSVDVGVFKSVFHGLGATFGLIDKNEQVRGEFESYDRKETVSRREKLKSAPKIKVGKYKGDTKFADALAKAGTDVQRGDKDDTPESKVDDLRKTNEGLLYDNYNRKERSLTIPFVYFGDIVNFALKSVHGENKYINSRYKSLVTDILIYNPRLGKKLSVNIADIPVSLSLFQDWFINNIYAKQLITYPSRQFLQDLFSGLLVEALSPTGCYSDVPKRNTQIGFLEYTIGTESNKDPLDPKGCGRLHISTVRELRENSSRSPEANYYSYNVFYATESDVSAWKVTTVEEDTKRGVPWFTLGRDRGLIKAMNFTRSDIPYQREAKLFNTDSGDGLNNLREVYQVDVEMIGNNFFYPGVMIYVNPSTLILGNPANVSSIANRVGLVGYYMVREVTNSITPKGFTTKVKAIWQAGGSGKSSDSIVMQDKTNKGELSVCDCSTAIVEHQESNAINWTAAETLEIAPDKEGC